MLGKKEIRALALARRKRIAPWEKAAKDRAIREKLSGLGIFRDARTVLFYASFRDEADTIGLIEESIAAGKQALLPKVEGPELKLYRVKGVFGLPKGFMGIPEPTGDEAETRADINEADLVIVPGVAFDPSGGRLGYGKGYYDKLLARREKKKNKKIPLVALAYEAQIYEGGLPVEEHDVRMDFIITEKKIYHVKAKRSTA